jgi:D-alanyl-D-alanine carboxypeptidase/D-alanyl-D-alanine-endopeptidase (penicillin-binding protein 4)
MERSAASILFCLLWLCPTTIVRADLADEVNSILHDKSLAKVETGIEIVQLGNSIATSRVQFRHNSDIPLTPASNLKVVTTSAALDRLGPDFKFRTQLVFHKGDLILMGDGDPSFGDAELLTRVGWDVTTVFKNWAQQIKQLQLGPIKSVVVDDSIFDEQYFHPNWPADQRLNRYEAEVAGMNLNMNCLDVFVRPTRLGAPVTCLTNPPTRYTEIENQCVTGDGKPSMTRPIEGNKITLHGKADTANDVPVSITIHDGSMYAATVLNETLAAAGVISQQPPRRDRTVRALMIDAVKKRDKSWQTLAVHETPLPQVMARANKDSMNLYAECLCKRLGAYATGQPGSWENGTAAVGEFLTRIGVSANEFHLDDGCGLSKENVISASAMAQVLMHNYFSPNAKTFTDSLSVAGQDGTLNDRFPNSSLRGRVFGKTGTVNGVSCLSGYLNAQDGHVYAFSILMNKSYAGAGKPMQEKIVAAIDNGKLATAR